MIMAEQAHFFQDHKLDCFFSTSYVSYKNTHTNKKSHTQTDRQTTLKQHASLIPGSGHENYNTQNCGKMYINRRPIIIFTFLCFTLVTA